MSANLASYAKRIAVALALAVPNAGFAATCDATLIPTASMARLDYDPFAFTRPVERITFEVESRANAACEVEFVLLDQTRTAVSSTTIGSSGVQVGFLASTGDAALVPTAVPGTWRASLQPATRTRLAIQAIVTQDAVASAGEHATPLSLELRDVGALATTVAPMPVSVVLAVVPRAQMNIVGAIATFGQGQSVAQVDFGVLASNATRRVFLQIRADTTARLTIDSANAGRLLPEGDLRGMDSIAYSAALSGVPVDLTQHWEDIVDPPRTLAGTSLPLDITLGALGPHLAGTYSDTLTIVLSAL